MKPLMCLCVLLAAFYGCSRNDPVVVKRMDTAEALLWTDPDSSLAIMKRIDLAGTSSESTRARYALLTVQARSRMRIPATSDSLIRVALDYYRHRSTLYPEHLMRSHLYHADVLMDMGDYQSATAPLKQAQTLVHDDTPLPYRFLIESNLGYINRKSGLYRYALEHYSNAYQLAQAQQDTLWTMTALANLINLPGYDTTKIAARHPVAGLETYLPYLPARLQHTLLQNSGVWHVRHRDTLSAIRCYRRALSVDSTRTSTRLTLATLYEKRGDFAQADTLYPSILQMGTTAQKSRVHYLLSCRYQQLKDYPKAANHYSLYTFFAQEVLNARDSSQILELQARHDHITAAYHNYRRMTLLVTAILVLTVLVVIICIETRRRIRHHRERLRQTENTNALLEEKNDTLNECVSSQQKHLNQYKAICRFEGTENRIEPSDLSSLNLLLLLLHDRHVIRDTKDKEMLIHWCDLVYRGYAARLKAAYPELRLNDLILCCLLRTGFQISECAHILQCGEASIRKRIQRMYPLLHVQSRQEYLNIVLDRRNP